MKGKTLIRNSPGEEAVIQAGIEADPDAAEVGDEEFRKAKRGRPALLDSQKKQPIKARFDPDVIAAAKAEGERTGRGYTTVMNDKLREAFGL